jgi:glucose/arabinose dehydrogenase
VTRFVKGIVKLQIVRIKTSGSGVGTEQKAIFTMKGATTHLGGRLLFGADGKMYLSVGDIGSPTVAQKATDPHGKILRMNPDATIPTDNPVAGSRVYARGLRSPVGADVDPETGVIWGGDLGPSCNDEVNRLTANANLGWGAASTCSTPPAAPLNTNQSGAGAHLPEQWWGAPVGPRGMTFCAGCALGAAVDGTLLVSTVNTNEIRALTLNAQRDGVSSESTIFTHSADVLGLESAPDGSVWFSDATGIWKLALT